MLYKCFQCPPAGGGDETEVRNDNLYASNEQLRALVATKNKRKYALFEWRSFRFLKPSTLQPRPLSVSLFVVRVHYSRKSGL